MFKDIIDENNIKRKAYGKGNKIIYYRFGITLK